MKKPITDFTKVLETKKDLERDLLDCQFIKDKLRREDDYATRFYNALCNTRWYHNSNIHGPRNKDDAWSCSWRYAGDLVSTLRACGEDYLDYYCSGGEGHVDPDIEKDSKQLGWRTL